MGNWNGTGDCIRVSVQRLDRLDSISTTHQERNKKWRLYPNELAKGGWFTALHNGYIFLALNTKGAGIDTGYFTSYTLYLFLNLRFLFGSMGMEEA